jgi:hypothetical protein
MQGFDVQFEATPSQFAAVLRQLTALKELKLASLKMMPEQQQQQQQLNAAAGPAAATAAAPGLAWPVQVAPAPPPVQLEVSGEPGMHVLLAAVAGLPQLVSLGFIRFSVSSAAAAELAAATRLASLRLDECGLSDEAVAGLAGSLTQLRSLSLN